MSFEGLNFDIVSGLSAGVIALAGAWVQWALVGHLLVFRKLCMSTAGGTHAAKDGGSDSNWSVPVDAR